MGKHSTVIRAATANEPLREIDLFELKTTCRVRHASLDDLATLRGIPDPHLRALEAITRLIVDGNGARFFDDEDRMALLQGRGTFGPHFVLRLGNEAMRGAGVEL